VSDKKRNPETAKTNVVWYFDFISPFAYLQFEKLDQLQSQFVIEYRPVLFAGLLNHWGQLGPAEIEPKRRHTYQQVLWMARREGIPFKMPPAHPFNPISALRLAIALECSVDAIKTIFRFIWAEGNSPDRPDNWQTLLSLFDDPDLDGRVQNQNVKDRLRKDTEEAARMGVFGVPSIGVGHELFWGFDMTEMAVAYLNDPNVIGDSEMQRVRDLPVGVMRRPK